jgi:dihydroorotate dehydrogenase (NAD+) catalytic subunit
MVRPPLVLAPEREGSLALRSPLIAGPSAAGYGRDAAKLLPLPALGALITTTTTLHARQGQNQPRLIETPAGFLMSTGMPNPGLRTVLHRHTPAWERLGVPIILSLAAEDAKTFAYCVEVAQDNECIAAFALETDLLAGTSDIVRVVDVVRGITALPLLVRTPAGPAQTVSDAVTDLAAVGCDAVIVGSPWPGLAMDAETGKPALQGALSGPAVRPLALRLVYDVARQLGPEHIPLIGAGGVSSSEDVAAFLVAGAGAVLLESVLWVDPQAVWAMVEAAATS